MSAEKENSKKNFDPKPKGENCSSCYPKNIKAVWVEYAIVSVWFNKGSNKCFKKEIKKFSQCLSCSLRRNQYNNSEWENITGISIDKLRNGLKEKLLNVINWKKNEFKMETLNIDEKNYKLSIHPKEGFANPIQISWEIGEIMIDLCQSGYGYTNIYRTESIEDFIDRSLKNTDQVYLSDIQAGKYEIR